MAGSFVANAPVATNAYNVLLAGPASNKLSAELPERVGTCISCSNSDVYDAFLQRRNAHLVGEAGRLIAQMLTDVSKGLTPIISASSQKECIVAYKNSLMKKVFVHESMKKFVDRVRKDGQVELHVITGDVSGTEFGKYGSLVFELFYRVDLSTMS